MKVAVILNMDAGLTGSNGADIVSRVARGFLDVGVEPEMMPVDRAHLDDAVRAALAGDAAVVAVGGGDGSLSTAASILSAIGGRKPLGVLPLGTFNHFARDLGIPLLLEDAVRTIAQGTVRTVDLGEMNGRVFVNNSTIGVYADFVRVREKHRAFRGMNRWLAALYGLAIVLRNFPLLQVRLGIGERTILRQTTSFLFVGNNEYDRGLFSLLGGRSALDQGRLSVYIARKPGRIRMARLLLRVLTGFVEPSPDMDVLFTRELTIRAPRRRVLSTIDGEVRRARLPIHYRIRPGALRVIVPADGENGRWEHRSAARQSSPPVQVEG